MSGIMQMIKMEALREFEVRTKYKVQFLSSIAIYTVTYLIVIYIASSPTMAAYYHTSVTTGKVLILIGYLYWNAGVLGMDAASDAIESDAKAGILESELQSPHPLWLLIIVRSGVNNILGIFYFLVIISLSSFSIKLTLLKALVLVVQLFLISMLSNIGMSGIGFVFGAVSVHVKRVGQRATIIQTALLLIGNITIPLFSPLQNIIPFVSGIEISRLIYLQHSIPLNLILIYIAVNFIWLIIGVCIFQYSIKYEKTNGSFEVF
ncbi:MULTISPECIES: hypothetical protein [Pediococcus]|uniref:hypothetical protein n=1 Tax=Pediococcus TaxID=1253 RepID=UPI000E87F52C|nr:MULTISPECIES: hypothetical protein [Pediococcus]MCT3029145.1 hypothetical protein [Pediococcus parvulus]HBO47468.1 hypothetical protein [Pediococcus sp.]